MSSVLHEYYMYMYLLYIKYIQDFFISLKKQVNLVLYVTAECYNKCCHESVTYIKHQVKI